MKFDRNDKIEIFENAISWIVVFAMFVYGGAKIVQFDGAAEIDKTVSEMTGMELMWAFYGYSKAYAITLGLFEIIGGTLILIKRTRIIGCLFTSTILVNVILQNIFFQVHFGALKVAILYQLVILIILWLNKDKVIQSIKSLIHFNTSQQPRFKFILKLGIAFICFVILRIAEYFITMKL
ncbi:MULTISPECIES: hypothetical protein [unclassified Flavobacterium]|uniref:hypothetical protein n=1 Tax=unclassified Flavobacterium TaxID=196869 RepID=UPI00131D148A|nr:MULTISPECIES: hypothetical protein [unclassified Flavobacterium]